jgi:hypothetical protein
MSIEAIRALEIAAPAREDFGIERTRDLADGEEAAVVNGSAVVGFGPGISAQAQEDVLYSMQLAAARANKVASRDSDIEGWYHEYIRVLELTGWVVRGFAPVARVLDEGEVEMDKVALTILSAAVTGPAVAVLQAAVKALEGMADDSGFIRLFESFGQSDDVGNFQLGAVERGAGEELNLGIGAYQLKTRVRKKKILFIKWRRNEVDLWGGAANATFNQAAYATVREAVKEKLGPGRVDAIAALDIAL